MKVLWSVIDELVGQSLEPDVFSPYRHECVTCFKEKVRSKGWKKGQGVKVLIYPFKKKKNPLIISYKNATEYKLLFKEYLQ